MVNWGLPGPTPGPRGATSRLALHRCRESIPYGPRRPIGALANPSGPVHAPGRQPARRRPDLPEDRAWPVIDGIPAAFVGQLDSSEIAAAIWAMRPDAGKSTGLLSFFCDCAFRIRGESGEDDDNRFHEVPLAPEAEMMNIPSRPGRHNS